MNKIEVTIEILSYAKSQIGSYVIVLSELNSSRKLPIIIKATDAQFIAIKMEGIEPPRPMTQDLFKSMTDGYGIDVLEVFIHSVNEGIFYAKMTTSNMIEMIDIDCTVGDALAMASLYKCPIFVSDVVMDSSSVDMSAPATTPTAPMAKKKAPKKKEKVESIEDLNNLLQEALQLEEYELAVELRDKIANIKK